MQHIRKPIITCSYIHTCTDQENIKAMFGYPLEPIQIDVSTHFMIKSERNSSQLKTTFGTVNQDHNLQCTFTQRNALVGLRECAFTDRKSVV